MSKDKYSPGQQKLEKLFNRIHKVISQAEDAGIITAYAIGMGKKEHDRSMTLTSSSKDKKPVKDICDQIQGKEVYEDEELEMLKDFEEEEFF